MTLLVREYRTNKKGGAMVILNLVLKKIYGFDDFTINFSYPKKIVNSFIEAEHLKDRERFRYKKAVILMGANAAELGEIRQLKISMKNAEKLDVNKRNIWTNLSERQIGRKKNLIIFI